MEWSTYNHLYYSDRSKSYLLYSSLSNRLIELDEDDYNTVLQIKEDPDCIDPADEQFNFLFDGRFVVESNETELNKLILSTMIKRFNHKNLSLTIAPTRACNFSCPYCYEDDRANKRMSKSVQDSILDFVKNRYSAVDTLSVTWYGGEPSLEIDTIKYLSSGLQKLVKNYSAYMVTNGYRLDKLADSMADLKITGLQITLDGMQETHNKTRCLKNGGATFDKILSNLDLLLAQNDNLRISIRMNIDADNSDQYVPLYHALQERFGRKVHLYPAFVRDYGGGCKAGSCYENSFEKAKFLKEIYHKHGVYTKDIYPLRAPKGCMIQSINGFVIGPEGELYKCWHHLGVPDKIVGSVEGPEMITNYSLLSNVMINGDVLSDDNCKACVLFPSCYGGCMDDKNRKKDHCIPAKSMLEDFIDIHYATKVGDKESV